MGCIYVSFGYKMCRFCAIHYFNHMIEKFQIFGLKKLGKNKRIFSLFKTVSQQK